ncbi:MAG TPA: HAMP domain-containing sensor histidine kinase [Patescibacteria group bacterium]|jgi:signal transduction histidine kinase|nr:HAMP domain-containing sensor histidine kinase [Patescibacteria group bacterium]
MTGDIPTGEQLRLITAAAHELKTPLTIIAHLASVLDDSSVILTADELQQTAKRIQYTAERTLRMVQDLTLGYRLSQMDQLSLALELEPVNAMQIAEEVAHELTPFALAREQSIIVEPARRQYLVVAHRRLLHSVFFNLIDNSVRHNPPKTDIRLSAQKRPGLVRVHVQDTGAGIDRSDFNGLASRLGNQSQAFNQGGNSSSGLGLYISGQLAMAMGGQLGLARSGGGTDFRVDLVQSLQLGFL